MKINVQIVKQIYNRLNPAKKAEPIAKAIREAIDPSNIKIALKDSRTFKPANVKGDNSHLSKIIAGIPEHVRKEAAQYPKGTFRRTNQVYIEPISNKRHVIAYEGITVDFDITTEGWTLPKIRNYYIG